MSIDEIVQNIRQLYPNAISVRLNVRAHSHEISVDVATRHGSEGDYYTRLDGRQIKREE